MDIAKLHEFSDEGQEFFNNMAETEMLELFNLELIRKLIQFKWPIIKENILNYLFLPFLVYLCATVFYTSFLWQKTVNDKTENWLVNFVVEETIVVLSLYFLGLEML